MHDDSSWWLHSCKKSELLPCGFMNARARQCSPGAWNHLPLTRSCTASAALAISTILRAAASGSARAWRSTYFMLLPDFLVRPAHHDPRGRCRIQAKGRPQYAERPSGIKIYSRWNAR